MSCNYISVIAAFVVGFMFALCCVAQTAHETIPKQADPLKTFLRKYLGEPEAAFEQDGPQGILLFLRILRVTGRSRQLYT